MNGSRLNLYKRFIYSVSGFGKYRLLLNETPGKAVVYVILLTMILGAVSIIHPAYLLNSGISLIVRDFDDKVPDFRLANGELHINAKMPIILEGEGTTVIIDTSDSPNEAILDNYDNAILLTKNKMIQKSYANSTVQSFSSLQGLSMDKNSVKLLIPLLRWIIVLVFLFAVPFFILCKFASAVLISIVGLIANSATRAGLQFRDIYRISLYSMTLPLVLCTILDLIGVVAPIPFLVFYVLSGFYTFSAVKSIAASNMPLA